MEGREPSRGSNLDRDSRGRLSNRRDHHAADPNVVRTVLAAILSEPTLRVLQRAVRAEVLDVRLHAFSNVI